MQSNFAKWINGVKTEGRADILTIFLLCKITKCHCFIHLSDNHYWSSLKDEPNEHEEFIQKCSVHLAYAGRGICIQLVPRVQSLHYEIFGVGEEDTKPKEDAKPVIVGCLTAQENETLDVLLNTGLGSPRT